MGGVLVILKAYRLSIKQLERHSTRSDDNLYLLSPKSNWLAKSFTFMAIMTGINYP